MIGWWLSFVCIYLEKMYGAMNLKLEVGALISRRISGPEEGLMDGTRLVVNLHFISTCPV
jgi:hypothetical protein